ncbi:MAG TPA: transposase [Cyclobacteriaceae bacterium]|nr:transposase [Cyclobacteriaceae bacterium]
MELRQKGKQFSKRIIRQAVEAVESGLSRAEACQKYGMAYVTLCGWIKRYGSKDFVDNVRTKINSHQKRLVIKSIQEGRMTIAEANVAYNIKGGDTIRKWLRDSKKDSYVDIDSNESIMPTLNNSTQDLQLALRQANLKVLALETMIDVAEEELRIKIRKKSGAKQ